MAMGRRKRRQEALFITATDLPKSAGHPFYKKLNQLLAEAKFDEWIERRCQRYYAHEEKRGQPSIPPGVYFRMLLVGYFENLDSQRGIAWGGKRGHSTFLLTRTGRGGNLPACRELPERAVRIGATTY